MRSTRGKALPTFDYDESTICYFEFSCQSSPVTNFSLLSLIYQNLDTEFIWKETYDFLFPIAPSREDIDILEQLRREPLIVSNDDSRQNHGLGD